MSAADELVGDGVDFGELPQDMIPGDGQALERIIAGQRGLRLLYTLLAAGVGAESRFVAGLLARDFDQRFAELLPAGGEVLAALGAAGKEKLMPPEVQIQALATTWKARTTAAMLQAIAAFAPKALTTSRFVPWTSEKHEVFQYFRAALEAEDGHLAVVQLLAGLVAQPSADS